MNGARTTFMRRGYLLTALSALLLLAASAGTASAQGVDGGSVQLTVPQRVAEGDDVVVTVQGTAMVDSLDTTAANRTITVTVALGTDETVNTGASGLPSKGLFENDRAGQIDDVDIVSNPTVELVFPATTSTDPVRRTVTKTVTLRTYHDVDAEDETVTITGNADGGGNPEVAAKTFTIVDGQEQNYTLALAAGHLLPTGAPKEGTDITVDIKAVPPHFDGSDTLTLYVLGSDGKNARGYAAKGDNGSTGSLGTVAIGTATPDGGSAPEAADNDRVITVTPPMNDGNRVPDTITLEVDSSGGGSSRAVQRLASLPIDVVDVHQLPAPGTITAVAQDDQGKKVGQIVEGGDPVFLTITVDRSANARQPNVTDEKLFIDIRPDDPGSYEVMPARVEVASGASETPTTEEIKLVARTDENVNDDELVLSLVVSGNPSPADGMPRGAGESVGTFTIAVMDDTAKKISPKSEDDAYGAIMDAMEEGAGEEGLNPGESFMVYTSALFDVMDGYTASYGVAVEGDPAVSVTASTDSITVDAKSVGESKVTVTATAKAASSSFMADQSVSNVASITFPVTVTDKMLTLMIEMPDNVMEGNVVEGMSYHIPVTTNRAVHEDTMVTFMRDRSQSDADEDDYSIGDVTIMAGEHMAMAELMVTEDMMDDAGHAMGEQLVIYAMAGDAESNELMFTIWDEAVPALPLIAQLLLALFLMAGGARLYRRRQS